MHHAAKAYGQVTKQTASPRDLEAQLLPRSASRLQTIHDDWEGQPARSISRSFVQSQALDDLFLTSVTSNDNPLPPQVRQNIVNIGIFVMNHTLNVAAIRHQSACAA